MDQVVMAMLEAEAHVDIDAMTNGETSVKTQVQKVDRMSNTNRRQKHVIV